MSTNWRSHWSSKSVIFWTDLFLTGSQPLCHTDKRENSFLLMFGIESSIMIYSLKPLSIQQFLKNFYLVAQNSVYYNRMRSQPQFHAAMWKVYSYLFGFHPLLLADSTIFGIRQAQKGQSNTPLISRFSDVSLWILFEGQTYPGGSLVWKSPEIIWSTPRHCPSSGIKNLAEYGKNFIQMWWVFFILSVGLTANSR